MPTLNRARGKFAAIGVELSKPVDLLPEGTFPHLTNVRQTQFGAIESIPGMEAIAPAVGTSGHSLKRLNNTIVGETNPFKLFLGADTELYSGTTNFTQIDTGYSGGPLSFAASQPLDSPESWLYIGDFNKNRKVNTDDTVREVGIAPPQLPPRPELGNPLYKVVSECETAVGWSQSGISGAPTAVSRIPAATTIAYIVYDDVMAGFGWACLTPVDATADYAWARPGARVILDAGGFADIVTIEEVFNPVTTTTIQAITYDAGTSGPCCIVFSEPTPGLQRNSMILLDGTEAVRIVSTSKGPNGLYSCRCSTVGTYIPSDPVTGLVSLRVYTHDPVVATDTITGNVLQFTLTPPAGGSGTGAITFAGSNDCSLIQTRAVQPNDWMHFSIRCDKPLNLSGSSGRILLDVDATTNDFTQNYYWKEIRSNNFQSNASGTLTSISARQTSIRYDQIDQTYTDSPSSNIYSADGTYTGYASGTYYNPGPTSLQIDTGSQQWSEILFRVSDLQRAGSDTTRTLKDVQSIRVEFTVSDEDGATTTFEVDSWWIGGGYGPDVIPGSPTGIKYRYRYRDSRTGARSMPSPANRYEIFPQRQLVQTEVYNSSDPQVDSIDVERYDPTIQSADVPTRWVYVGTVDNVTQLFLDDLVIDLIASNPPLDTNVFKPFAVQATPMAGTVNICGTSITWVSGDQFPTELAPGTIIKIDSVAYQTYGPPFNQTFLQIVDSGVAATNVPYQIDSPVLWGQPAPYVFGPLEGPTASFNFALGDPYNPGRLYWTNGNNPDGHDDSNYIDVTGPNEPLISGQVWNTTIVVGSQNRLFLITFNPGSSNLFIATEIPSPSGMAFRWGTCAGRDGIHFIGNDGIYKTDGHTVSVTSGALWPLFPHDGKTGTVTNLYQPVNYTYPYNRLSFSENDIYFDYLGEDNEFHTWRYDGTGWWGEQHTPTIRYHYWEDAPEATVPRLLLVSSNGLVLNSGAADDDNGTPMPCTVWTPANDNGDSRSLKLYMDVMTDFEDDVDVQFHFNNYEITGPTDSYSTPSGDRTQDSTNIAESDLTLYRNIGGIYTFTYPAKLYEWEPSFYAQTEGGSSLISTTSFLTPWMDHGIPGWKQLRFRRISLISTGPVTLTIYGDDGTLDTQPLPATAGATKALFDNIANASKAKLLRYALTSDYQFVLFPDESYIRLKKWGGESFLEIKPFV